MRQNQFGGRPGPGLALLWALVISGLALLPALLIHGRALAHSGHVTAYIEQVQAGPYMLIMETNLWPIKAHMNVDLVVLTGGGPQVDRVYARLIPPPGSTLRPFRTILTSHATMAEALTYYNFKVLESGIWQLEFEVEGAQGRGVGRTEPFAVEGPPSFPLWLGYLITASPAIGFGWFLWRERRRVVREMAALSAARP